MPLITSQPIRIHKNQKFLNPINKTITNEFKYFIYNFQEIKKTTIFNTLNILYSVQSKQVHTNTFSKQISNCKFYHLQL